jgi:hypothetical protein
MRDIRLCLGQYEQRLTPDADARISDPPDLSDQTVGAAASPLAAAAPGPPAAPGTDGARVRRWRLLGLVVVVLALAVPTAVQTLPSLPQIGHQVAPNDGDPLFVTWTLAWEAHAVVHEPADLFAANIFYPRRDAVAWSDNLLVLMPVYALAAVVSGGNMVMAYNIVTFLGFLGVGLAVYALGVELLDDRRSALIAATLFSLSMTRSLSVGHTQLVGFLFVPLALVALLRFLERRALSSALAFGAAAAATWLVTGYYAVLLALVVASFMVVWLAQRRGRTGARFWPGLGLGVVVAGVLVAPTLGPYVALQRSGLFDRPEARLVGSRVADLGQLPPSLLYRWLRGVASIPDYGRGGLFPGLVLLVLVAIAVLASVASGWRRWRRPGTGAAPPPGAEPEPSGSGSGSVVAPLAAGAVVCLAVMAGPGGRWSGPYDLLRAAVPGIASLRALDRFWAFPMLCLALLAGRGAAVVLKRLSGHWRSLAAGAVVAAVWAELLFRPPVVAVDLSARTTAADRALRRLPPGPVLELPQPVGPAFAYVNANRELRSLIDRDPRVDGYSGNVPPLTSAVERLVARTPIGSAIPFLRNFGVRYVVLNGGAEACSATYSPAEIGGLRAQLAGNPGVVAIRTAGTAVIVELAPAAIDRQVPQVAPTAPRPLCPPAIP